MTVSRRRFVTEIMAAGAVLATVAPLSLSASPMSDGSVDSKVTDWTLGPFRRAEVTPCLMPDATTSFECPVRKAIVHWEEKDVICATAVVHDGKVCVLYRAEDRTGGVAGKTGRGWGTSRIGLAFSDDGVHFTRHPTPVLYPDNDFMKVYEWDGGCQDPRIVKGEDGRYYMTYTAWDGKVARLAIASSSDLIHWKKHGLVFDKAFGGKYRDWWTKSGAIVVRREGESFIATRIDGRYWMYYNDSNVYVATSHNLIDWEPLQNADGSPLYAFGPRKDSFDSRLTEPGPFGLVTDKGILLIYNGAYRTPDYPTDHRHIVYAAGQALLSPKNPVEVLDRTTHDFFHPELPWELKGHNGQLPNVVFLESLVLFKGEWFIYYGAADSNVGVAKCRQST